MEYDTYDSHTHTSVSLLNEKLFTLAIMSF